MDIRERRSWMYNRLRPRRQGYTKEFEVGLKEFMQFAATQPPLLKDGGFRCHCLKCNCRKIKSPDKVELDLLKYGFQPNYWYWTAHGEIAPEGYGLYVGDPSSTAQYNIDNDVFNTYENLVYNAMGIDMQNEVELSRTRGSYDHGREEPPNADARRPLWPGCESQTELSLILQMMCLKSDYNLPQGCFDRMTKILKSSTPSGSCLPKNFYEAKKFIKKFGLTSEKIDCCVGGCMIYYKLDSDLNECKFCGHPRYKPCERGKKRQVPYKRMHYLPLIPRLKRLYASLKSAEHMRWHFEHKRELGVLCHPSDGLAWKHFDEKHIEFAAQTRNVRLGLCADGFNPFNHSSTQYSCWPVIVTPYNLPPEMCMITPYMFLTCLIPRPHNPKERIDVYLQPLIDELKVLWVEGVETYDISRKENFRMRAALMWTINDFPTYGMLSGWMTFGKLACPICMRWTKAFRLKHGGKMSWFDCHRQFLPPDHPFRNNKDAFYKGRRERSVPPPRISGEQMWEEVRNLPKITDLHVKHSKVHGYGEWHNWTKQSIFWQLPYWKDNLVRHNLDVMHIEKNFFDNVLNTVMDVKEKTKDNDKARLDLVEYCKRSELHLKHLPNGKMAKPKASFTLSDDERRDVCTWLEQLKMPDGYASNLSRCVDKTKRKLHGMKSHDCHVLMQRLLPIAFNILPQHIWKPLTELSQFFRDLCSTELQEDNLLQLERNISVILCKLEWIFPPGFFDSMEHLPIHLPYEALMCGPDQYRWMYPFEM